MISITMYAIYDLFVPDVWKLTTVAHEETLLLLSIDTITLASCFAEVLSEI